MITFLEILGVLSLVMLLFLINYGMITLYETNSMKNNYKRLVEKQKIAITHEEFIKFNKKFCKKFDFMISSYDIKYIDKEIAYLKIKSNYFSYDGINLKFIFCSKCLIENEINKYIKEKNKKSK